MVDVSRSEIERGVRTMLTENLVDDLLREVVSEAFHARPTCPRIRVPALFDECVARRRGVCQGGPVALVLRDLHRMAVNDPDRVRRLFEAVRAHHSQSHLVDEAAPAEAI
jgi:hypothetical protein